MFCVRWRSTRKGPTVTEGGACEHKVTKVSIHRALREITIIVQSQNISPYGTIGRGWRHHREGLDSPVPFIVIFSPIHRNTDTRTRSAVVRRRLSHEALRAAPPNPV